MANPTRNPNSFGEACWTFDRAESLISTTAQVDIARADAFLACHSPLEDLRTSTGEINEAQAFSELIKGRASERLAVVKGEPGSGKSHFINWLRLRFDDAITRGEIRNFMTVMVKRRSGSLRDALEQLVEQLPGFGNYLDPIRSAIQGLSEDSASRQLCFRISEQLRESRDQRDRKLRPIDLFFHDLGPRDWLCRPNGAVQKNIQRLVSKSEIDEREALPLFSEEDFDIRDPQHRRKINPEVQGFIDELDDSPSLRAKAVEVANDTLRPALMALTGLGNQTLNQIFRGIRTELKRQGKSLAVFIEDVSTLNALDVEVVNALEEQNDPSLCRLISVLGMTEPAFARLPDNIKDRIHLQLTIAGGDENGPLSADSGYADRFVARYLNAIRLSDHQVGKVAEARRSGHDVVVSACDECHIRQQCVTAFGSVEIEGQEIGLFPFSPGTAHRLINGLSREQVRRNPRGLLKKIVEPLLQGMPDRFSGHGPNMSLGVESHTVRDEATSSGRFLGGWGPVERARLPYVLWYWTGQEDLIQGAATLERLLPFFGLPKFSEKAPTATTGEKKDEQKKKEVPTAPVDERELQKFTKLVQEWNAGAAKLKQDNVFRRDILLPLIRHGVSWLEGRQPTARAREKVVSADAASIDIEDMTARPAAGAALTFKFPKDGETAEVLTVGLEFEHRGHQSWNYEGGGRRRRVHGKWIRSHEQEVLLRLEPDGLDASKALTAAIRFLIVAYQFSEKKPVGSDYSVSVNALCSFTPKAPPALTNKLTQLAQDLPARVERIREFVFGELSIAQGWTGSINFIDPLPLVRELAKYKNDTDLIPVDPRFGESFWKSRFAPVVELAGTSWKSLRDALEAEKAELEKQLSALSNRLSSWGYTAPALTDQIQGFFDGCQAVTQALRDTKETLGHQLAEEALRNHGLRMASWKSALRNAQEIADGSDFSQVLQFDSVPFVECSAAVTAVSDGMASLENNIKRRLTTAMGGSDLDEELRQTHELLRQLINGGGG